MTNAIDAHQTPNQDHDAPKKRLLVKAAIKIFARRGYHNTRVSDIVREVGAAQGVFYYYFKSKDEALLTIFEYAWHNLLKKMNDIEASHKDPWEKLKALITYIFQSFQANPDLMKVLIMDVPRLDRFYEEDAQALYNEFFVKLSEVIKDGQEKGIFDRSLMPLAAAYVLHGAVDSLIRHHVFNPQSDSECIPTDVAAQQALRILANGLIQFTP
ncbi:MAG: TetR/AcrR family transcriptional regulator [Desulfomonilaceae bacterium]